MNWEELHEKITNSRIVLASVRERLELVEEQLAENQAQFDKLLAEIK